MIRLGHMSKPAPFSQLEQTIGIRFRDKDILLQALTHRSAMKQSRAGGHNERLEFLGDAVLELITTEHLFTISDKSEGELTSWRSAIVKGEHLAEVGEEMQLGKYLIMSNGEEASGGRKKESNLANGVEALIGAIHFDQGFESARDFCMQFILKDLIGLLAEGRHRDDKSHFQERAQELLSITPHYEVLHEEGPDHDKVFTCGLYVDEELIAEGNGPSKQKAEQDAAKNGLREKGW